MLTYDRKISISVGASRRATYWKPQVLTLSELYTKLSTPARGTETLAEYLNMKKAQQDELKDVGGFVGGTLNGPRRKSNNVTGRDIITLDFDSVPAGETDKIVALVDRLGCGYCIYSTRKHQPSAPRLRVVLPIDRTVTAEEYEPLARRMGEYIGLEYADPTTFEPCRLMYWPSCCSDSQYVFRIGDKPLLPADKVLKTYGDWHDMSKWPALPGQQQFTKFAVKQGNPETKAGIVGVFCRTFDIQRAMDELIPGIYEPVDNAPDRFTYVGGSTTGGAVLYDNGRFLYSHHATDPCSGKLVNSFDLVRLHKFGDLDDTAQENVPSNRLPSFLAMTDFALTLPDVTAQRAAEDFAGVEDAAPAEEKPWTSKLTLTTNGGYEKTLNNIMLIMQNVEELHGCARKDAFANRIYTAENLPWRDKSDFWGDFDTTELRRHFETEYKFRPGKQDIKDAVVAVAQKQQFHPVRDYLSALKWDGQQRLDTVFIDYLGVADTPYSRAVSRKALVGAVARIMQPGCKFDYMLVFVGRQGRGKSTIIAKLAGPSDWFCDSLATFDGKNAFEAICGKWLIEIPEMNTFDKVTMNQAKAFISKQSDYFRAAYAEFPEDRPRQCTFFGTTNNPECLRDETGGRRFWPLDIDVTARTRSIFRDLDNERDQIWAEAVMRWRAGEPLYLSPEIESIAVQVQEAHRERHPWTDTILNFLEKEIPENWEDWDISKRMLYWAGNAEGVEKTVKRDKVCVKEIWQECFNGGIASLDGKKSREISSILVTVPGWKKAKYPLWFKQYGNQRGFMRHTDA